PIVEVGDEHLLALDVESQTVDAAELRLQRRTAVAVETLLAGAGKGRDGACFRIELANAVVERVGQVDGTIRTDGQGMHTVEGCFETWTTVAAVALFTGAGDDGQRALGINLADAMANHFDENQVAGRVEADAEWTAELGVGGRDAIADLLVTAGHQDQFL